MSCTAPADKRAGVSAHKTRTPDTRASVVHSTQIFSILNKNPKRIEKYIFRKRFFPFPVSSLPFSRKVKSPPGEAIFAKQISCLPPGVIIIFSFRIPAQSNRMYCLFSYKQHLLRRFPSCGKRRTCVREVPSVHRLLPDPSASSQIF